ncbi:hypothetical protein [Faecalimonas sp.]
MNYINIYGFIIIIVMMIPNLIYAKKHPEGFINLWQNKAVEIFEQIGRIGCYGFMCVILPWFKFGVKSDEALVIYLIANGILLATYCFIWIICFNKNSIFRCLALSIIPSVLFLLSGILSGYLPLIISAIIFDPCHILISYKNTKLECGSH